MGVQVKREDPEPSTEPIEAITINGVGGRSITIRIGSATGTNKGFRTVECKKVGGYDSGSFKWATTLGDLKQFGQAIVDMCEGK